MPTVDNLRQARIRKLEELKKRGIDPYPAVVKRDQAIFQAKAQQGKSVSAAGRIMGLRGHGKIYFIDLQDESGKIQVVLKNDLLSQQTFDLIELLDIGDFIAVQGKVDKTQAGEISIFATDFQLLTKTIRPLPDQWHGLKDIEERYRKRYLDILLNEEVKKRLQLRSIVVDAIRDFLTDKNFLEVETPTLQPVYGGGFARPFVTHHHALDSDFYLRISDEMYLKRLIVAGFEKVFEITKVFRNEGVDHDHNPEFTMFEAQIAYQDYSYGMDIIEEIIEYVVQKVHGITNIQYQGNTLDFRRPWNRFTLVEAVKKYAGVNPFDWKTTGEAKSAVQKMLVAPEKLASLAHMRTWGELVAFIFEELVEEKLIVPTIIHDYPVETSPLAKKCEDPRFTQRFEMFANGSELGNNYTELNDPLDLRNRFIEEKKREKAGFEEAHQTDDDYLEAIEYGFPPTCGIAIGVDRLVMLLSNAKSIKEVIPFPTLRPNVNTQIKKVTVLTINRPDVFQIDPKVKQAYPSISVGIALIKGVSIQKSNPELESEKGELLKKLKVSITEGLGKYQEVLSYRRLYREMGVDWHSRRPSPEALLRRAALGKGLYTINTCVDAYNLVVMKRRVSLGAFDLDQIKLPAILRFAKRGETILLLGDTEPTEYTEKELAYFDQAGGYNIDFNYRDAQRTLVTEKTRNIWINVDGVYEITPQQVEATLKEAVNKIIQYCGGRVELQGVVI